jgi:hypothetical protein
VYGATYYGGSCFGGITVQPGISQARIVITTRLGPRFVGDLWRLSIAITDEETRQPVDPTIVSLTIERPDRTKHSVMPSRTSTGRYSALVPLTSAQVWRADVVTGGNYTGTGVADIVVLNPLD